MEGGGGVWWGEKIFLRLGNTPEITRLELRVHIWIEIGQKPAFKKKK